MNLDQSFLSLLLDNKYTKIYLKLAQRAQHRTLSKYAYVEKHHIFPRSLGGKNDTANIARFTAREHYLAHLLLTKMLTGEARRSMCFALSFFNTGCKNLTRIKPNSHWYEYSRKLLSEAWSGRINSQKNKDAVSKAKKGIPLTDDQRKKISDALSETIEAYLISPENIEYHELDVRSFCKLQNISYYTIAKRLTEIPFVIKKGKNKGWIFSTHPIINPVEIRNKAIEQCHDNLKAGAKSQWTPTRKAKNREKRIKEVILQDSVGQLHKFKALSDVKNYQGQQRAVSTIQTAKNNVQLNGGAWAGWIRLK